MNTNLFNTNENNTELVYTVSTRTARYMDLLKKLVKVQKEIIDFMAEEDDDDAVYDMAEPIGKAIKLLGASLDARIYEKIVEGETEI